MWRDKRIKINLLPEIQEKISRPFGERLLETQGLIARNLLKYKGKIAIAWSGGKDSTLVLYLATCLCPDIPVIFNNTGVEYPETLALVKEVSAKWNLNLYETKPERTFWDCVEQHGFPGTKRGSHGGRRCCYWLKDKPMKQTLKALGSTAYFTGITAVENRTRMFLARDYGMCYVTQGMRKIHPIMWWTPEEVMTFTEEMGLPINKVYSLGAERCGCMVCTAFISWEKQLSKTKPKVYQMIKRRKNNVRTP